MGLIKAITGAAGGVLADSWREFFYCDADVLNENTLAAKGQKRISDKGRSSNTKGESNIISDGSIIAVNDGQCMIIVESGEIVDVCAEPGQFVYDRSTEPSIFYGGLGEGIKNTFARIGQRFTFGGDTGKDQRVYYFNTKEIYGNKYGTTSPIPFRIVDANLGLDMDAQVRMNGEYSYKLTDPLLFYKNVCGNVEEPYTRDRLDSQMKSELLTALQPALARISEMGIRYSAVPAHTKELADFLNDELSQEWGEHRGIQVEKFGVNSITLPEEIEKQLSTRQMAQTMVDPRQAAAVTANAAANAMQDAANNTAGAMTGFMGMGMAQGMGGQAAASMYAQGAGQPGFQQPQSAYPMAEGGGFGGQAFPPQGQPQGGPQGGPGPQDGPQGGPGPQDGPQGGPQGGPGPQGQPPMGDPNVGVVAGAGAPAGDAEAWTCPECGQQSTANFCSNCGTKKPEPPEPASWFCPECGQENAANFCSNCGTKRP